MPDLTPPKRTSGFGLPDDGAWQRSYVRLPATVAEIAGHPVKAYGRTFVYGVSPDFSTDLGIQRGALAPQTKLVPKKSWELRENHCGSMVSYQPRLPQNDFQPFLSPRKTLSASRVRHSSTRLTLGGTVGQLCSTGLVQLP